MTKYYWKELYSEINGCQKCRLCEQRTNIVIGEGDPKATIMFIGEGPGLSAMGASNQPDSTAGQLLDKMIGAIGFRREEVYIANVVKCRPPNNRTPEESEADACLPYLRVQFALIRPKIIVCLGATAAKYIYDSNVRITRDRGVRREWGGVWILPTYHPAALLRDESKKREAWEDMQKLKQKYDEIAQNT